MTPRHRIQNFLNSKSFGLIIPSTIFCFHDFWDRVSGLSSDGLNHEMQHCQMPCPMGKKLFHGGSVKS